MGKHEQSIVAISPKNGKRRSFSRPFKRQLVEQTLRPDVSVAGVALANGVNTNLLARWRRNYLSAQAAGASAALIPVHVVENQPARLSTHAHPAMVATDGEIEIRLGKAVVVIRGMPDQAMLGVVLANLLHAGCGSSK